MRAIYFVLSSIFFLLAAFAQHNDPDPHLWIPFYLLGCVLSAAFGRLATGSYRTVHQVVFAVVTLVIVNLGSVVLQSDVHRAVMASERFSVWPYFELEEGRELGGALVLYAHALLLLHWSYVDEQHSAQPQRKQREHSWRSAVVGVSLFVAVLSTWIAYQPMMVERYMDTVDYCRGAFSSIFGNT